MEKGISYLNRTFDDYKDALIEFSKKYYPDFNITYDDASVASWQIDLAADIADNLSYHIDRVYQETNIESAQERGSLYSIARNNGVKIPGPKGSMAEIKLTCILPANNNNPDWDYAPIIKRGSKFSSTSQSFELLDDVDFSLQFDLDGNTNRTMIQNVNTNGIITGYTVSKLAVVTAGETRVYRQVLYSKDVYPFMEIILPFEGVMNIESILEIDGVDSRVTPPPYGDFYSIGCSGMNRFYEVESLSQDWAWLDQENNGKPVIYTYDSNGKPYNNSSKDKPVFYITKGEWKPIERKFITEYMDNGYLKIIFGSGNGNSFNDNPLSGQSTMAEFSKWQITRILNNDNLGILPKENTTLFILYRIGGGVSSNVPKGAINKISSLNAEFRGSDERVVNSIYQTLRVENTTPSVSGKDIPSERELKYFIKYNKGAQNRCVTVKDYIDRILRLPPKYGTPFRVGVTEENNKIMVYVLGIDGDGKLNNTIPVTLINNMVNYLSGYKMINDFVEIKSGKIINISFDVDVMVDKNYEKTVVISDIINLIKNYMDVNRRFMGDDIYVGDIEKEISKVDGVINLIDLRVYNEHGNGYSSTLIEQETISSEYYEEDEYHYGDMDSDLIDIKATDGILYSDGDSMLEVKYPERDIRVRIKER